LRVRRADELERQLTSAMWQVQRDINQEIARAHRRDGTRRETSHSALNPDFPLPGRARSEQ